MILNIERYQYLERATDPRLLNKIPVLILIIFTTLIHILSSIDLEFSNFHIRIPLAVLSILPTFIIIFIGHHILKTFNLNKILIIFISYLLGGLIRGWLLESGLYWFGILSLESTNFRVSTGALLVTICAATVSFVWSTISDSLDNITKLHKETLALQQTLENLAQEIQTQELEQTLTVFKKITNELSELTSDSSNIQTEHLENLVNQVVRPLSRNFAPKKILENIKVITDPKISWSGVWKLFDPLRHLPSFRIAVWVLAISAMVPVRRIYGWETATELGVLVVISLYVSLFLINPIAQGSLNRFRSPVREIVMTLGFVLVAIPPSFATTIALRNTAEPNAYLIPGIITLPIFSWVLTIGNAAWEYSQSVITSLEKTRDQQRWALSRFNLLSWYKNGLISRLLHGPIQNSLQVAILKIQAEEDENKNSAVIIDVIKRIDQAIVGATTENRSAQNDLIAMDDALKTRQAIADIEIVNDELSLKALVQDPAGCAIFTDIIMEACSNAIRHGKSTKLNITYQLTAAGIELQIVDNGTWYDPVDNSGLGQELLSSCSIWFKRSINVGSNELSLELPLGNTPPN